VGRVDKILSEAGTNRRQCLRALKQSSDAFEILLVEDNPADVRLTREALEAAGPNGRLHAVRDGRLALNFLFQRGDYDDGPRPDLVLLGLNLPGVDGHSVLEQIKDELGLAQIPVVVLTTSDAARDVRESYRLHASWFVSKPCDYEGFVEVLQAIETYWSRFAELPPDASKAGS
jgi:CheY-like chemotaxis protein